MICRFCRSQTPALVVEAHLDSRKYSTEKVHRIVLGDLGNKMPCVSLMNCYKCLKFSWSLNVLCQISWPLFDSYSLHFFENSFGNSRGWPQLPRRCTPPFAAHVPFPSWCLSHCVKRWKPLAWWHRHGTSWTDCSHSGSSEIILSSIGMNIDSFAFV